MGDWVATTPDVFVASAIADVGIAVFNAARDATRGTWQSNAIHQIALSDPGAVRLSLAAEVPDAVKTRIAGYRDAIIARSIEVPETYDGAEFNA